MPRSPPLLPCEGIVRGCLLRWKRTFSSAQPCWHLVSASSPGRNRILLSVNYPVSITLLQLPEGLKQHGIQTPPKVNFWLLLQSCFIPLRMLHFSNSELLVSSCFRHVTLARDCFFLLSSPHPLFDDFLLPCAFRLSSDMSRRQFSLPPVTSIHPTYGSGENKCLSSLFLSFCISCG